MIIIEGPRNVGKTFLLKAYSALKFNSIDFLSKHDEKVNWGFTCGKDLMLNYLSKTLPNHLIFDRGFISTAVYGQLFNRASPGEIEEFLENFVDNPHIKLLYIKGNNPNSRSKDIYDSLDYNKQLKLYDYYMGLFPHQVFVNNFDSSSIYNFRRLMNEYLGF
jgi:predicted AAA+ superfamily ATPase